jgi:hypothetical protein
LSRGAVNWATVPYCQEVPADLDKYLVKDDDIFISRAGSVGFSAHVKAAPVNSVFASYLIRVRSNGTVLPDFLALFLNSPMYWDQVGEASAGIALANINAVKIKNLTIPVPPLAVQQGIVETLEVHLSRLDKALAETLAATVQVKTAISSFLHELDPANASAKGWALTSLGQHTEKPQYGWTTSGANSGSSKLLRTTDIIREELDWNTVPF